MLSFFGKIYIRRTQILLHGYYDSLNKLQIEKLLKNYLIH